MSCIVERVSDECLVTPEGAQMNFGVSTRRRAGAVRVAVSGEFDIVTAPMLEAAVVSGVVDGGDTVVLDLSAVTFIDSSGLHALMSVSHDLGERLRIVASDVCLRFMAIAGVADTLPLG